MLAHSQTNLDTASESFQDRLKRYILENKLVSGSSLPPEASMARELGISRASLREAISALQSQGILETHHGRGTYVSSFNFHSVVSSLGFHIELESATDPDSMSQELAQLVAMRELIESAVVAELIHEYRQSDILALSALANNMMQSAQRGEEFMDLDWRFHTYLYRRSGNEMLLRLLDSFWQICDQVRVPDPEPESLSANARNHQRIVDAIAARDARAASDAMRDHFIDLRSRSQT